MVYCNLRISNLSPEFAAGIPDTKGNFMILNYMVMLKVKLQLPDFYLSLINIIIILFKIDPAMAEFEAAEEAAEDDGMALPTRQNDEFRPFIRRYENIIW